MSTNYIERVPHSWTCAYCDADGEPQKYLKDHLREEHGWQNGEGWIDGDPNA